MGIFGTSSPFDQDVEKATSENNTSEDWGLILEICDRAGGSSQSAKECLRATVRRLGHADPHVQVQAATLLDACVANCGRTFHLEVASREFEAEFRRLVSRAQPQVAARLRSLLRKWAEGEFRSDPQLDLIPSLYAKLRAEGGELEPHRRTTEVAAAAAATAAPDVAAREQDELARAIALSLRESTAAAPATAVTASPSLYPRVDAAPEVAPARKVRALYDFEAAEDNELTFLAGEIVHVTDSSDPNWWKGYNERGEGLFPANFVTGDLSAPPPQPPSSSNSHKSESQGVVGSGGKSVQFAGVALSESDSEAEARVVIDENVMDEALALLLEADPEGGEAEGAEGRALEARVHAMGPLIDAALERADRRHARLTQLSADLVDALNLYHELMREPLKALYSHPPHHPPAPHQPHPAQYAPVPYPQPPPPRC